MYCTNHTEVLKLVVVERGSLGVGEGLAPSDRFSQVLVVVQSAGETLTSFAHRTASRLTRIGSMGHRVVEAAVFVGGCSGRNARSPRERLGRAVFAHLSREPAKLVLFAGSAPAGVRHEILALAGNLGAAGGTEHRGRVKVWFGSARGGPPTRAGPRVSSGNTETAMFSAGSAIGLSNGYAGVSREVRSG